MAIYFVQWTNHIGTSLAVRPLYQLNCMVGFREHICAKQTSFRLCFCHNVPRPPCFFSRTSASNLTKHGLIPKYKLITFTDVREKGLVFIWFESGENNFGRILCTNGIRYYYYVQSVFSIFDFQNLWSQKSGGITKIHSILLTHPRSNFILIFVFHFLFVSWLCKLRWTWQNQMIN